MALPQCATEDTHAPWLRTLPVIVLVVVEIVNIDFEPTTVPL